MLDSLSLRPLETQAEYRACTELQEEVWGRGFSERVSAAILLIANRLGGLAAGAFDPENRLVGFVFGLTGVREGRLVHWSDMLAVREEYRDRGLGRALKLYQREVMLDRGVTLMNWTFDPLRGRNAHLNFRRLGIESTEYVPDMYGETDSPLHRGVGTDRLIATWAMDSPRVLRRISGDDPPLDPVELEALPSVLETVEAGGRIAPGDLVIEVDSERVCLPIPADLGELLAEEPSLARTWRVQTRRAFLHYLEKGYRVTDFYRGPGVSRYLLERGGPLGVERP